MVSNIVWQITRNTLYGYGLEGHTNNVKESVQQERHKFGHFYLYIQMTCLKSLTSASPLIFPSVLLYRSIQIATTLVGLSFVARFILDLSNITPEEIKGFLNRFDPYLELFSKLICRAVLVHAAALFIFKKDFLALSTFTFSVVDLLQRRKSFLQEPIKLFHKTLDFVGQQFCYPSWILIPNAIFLFVFHFYKRFKKVNPAHEGYKAVLIDHYVEGLKELQGVLAELKAKFPDRVEQINEMVKDIKKNSDLTLPGDWAVFHEIHVLEPSLPFLDKLPERKKQLEDLAARIKELTPNKLKWVKYGLVLGADLFQGKQHAELKSIVQKFRHPANLYSGNYLGPQDTPDYRPHKDVLMSEQVKAAKAALILF